MTLIKENRLLFPIFIALGIILTSIYLFPFEFKAMLGLNTKQIVGVVGVAILGLRLSKGEGLGRGMVQSDFLWLSVYAILVSLAGLFSMTINNTNDNAYAYYIMSFWVWIGGAYTVSRYINWLHGKLSIPLVVNYLVAVCVFQCIMALWIDLSPSLKEFVDAHIEQGQDFLNSKNVHRLYGIGASLDVAGIRFSCVLIMIAYIVFVLERTRDKMYLPYYLLAFALITILGNIIARTTLVGVGLGLGYLFSRSWNRELSIDQKAQRVWKWVGITLLIAIPIVIYYYNKDSTIHKHIRFAFEGFFNLFENGKWETTSTDTLKSMYVYPDNLKTWIMGDGYFSNPINTDPYFIGRVTGGYYMGTDVGYLRFIFYFGTIGLLLFSNFFVQVCRICYHRFTNTRALFLMILLCNFIVWFKVSTDVFNVFALFLCIGAEENEEYMKSIALDRNKDNSHDEN